MFSCNKVTDISTYILTYHDHNQNTQFKKDFAVWLYLIFGDQLCRFMSIFECDMDRQ